MEKSNNKKMNFFVRVYKAVTNFETYTQFAIEPISKAIKYLAILVLIFSIIVTTIYITSFKSKISQGVLYLKENIVSKSKNTPWINKTLKGKVKYTLVSGRVVYVQ